MSATSIHTPTGRLASEHPGVVRLAKAGWLAKGIVYAVAGVLILLLAGSALAWCRSPTVCSPPTPGASAALRPPTDGALRRGRSPR